MKLLKPFLQYCRCKYQGLYSEVAAETPAAPSEDNANQLFVHLTAPKIVNPGTDFNERMKTGEFARLGEDNMSDDEYITKFGRERWSDEDFEAFKASVGVRMALWENKYKADLLTLFFNTTEKILRNSLDADAALKTMADAIVNVVPLSEKIEKQDIEVLDLSVRSYNILKRANINTIGDITKHSQYWLTKNVRNCGKKSMEEIVEKLAQTGVFLKEFAEGEAAAEEADKAEKAERVEDDDDEEWYEPTDDFLFDGPDENSAYNELFGMIGLTEAKTLISQILDFHKAQKLLRDNGIKQSRPSMHMAFMGSPGVGKTETARLFAHIMKENGLIDSGRLHEVSRAMLVGKYVGHTANIVKEAFREAKGGVLFIDEAHGLLDDRENSFGDEAIDAIVKEMEDLRDETIVIFSGYPKEMQEFINRNPGLRSRVNFHISLSDYDTDELYAITELIAQKQGLTLADDVKPKLMSIYSDAMKQTDSGNGRLARSLIEKARLKQASRLVKIDPTQISKSDFTLIADDFEAPVFKQESRKIGFGAE